MTGLKFRDDAYYVSTSDGVLILTPAREAVLTGPSIFQWVDKLAPYLDGRHTLAELTAALPADRKRMTERIISTLRELGVVVEAGEGSSAAASLTADERRLYRREIGFLGSVSSSGEQRFLAYRDSVVVLAGSGRMLTETAKALLSSGSRQIRVAITDECPTDRRVLDECERQAMGRDPCQRITSATADLADEDRLTDLVAGASIVVHASDLARFGYARALDLACSAAGIPFVSAILGGGQAWLGPFGPTGTHRQGTGRWPSWMSAWRRLCALDGSALAGHEQPPGAALTVVANQFVREVVLLLSGTETATAAGAAQMTRVDLRALRTESYPFIPHPLSLPASRQGQASLPDEALPAGVRQDQPPPPLDSEEFSKRVAGHPGCLRARLGVLSEITERDFVQIPLSVAQVRVSDPVLLLEPGVPLPVVTGAGLSLAEARRAAILRGLAAYGSLMVDPRRLHVREDTSPGLTGNPDEDLAALRAGQWSGFVWGRCLADGQPRALAAEAAFPALSGARPGALPPPGACAGYDWHEAMRGGLIGQCRRVTLTEIGAGRGRFRRIRWHEAALDARGRRYRSMVKIIGGNLEVYDVTCFPRMPTLAFRRDGVTVAYASGFSFSEALRDGLAEVLLTHQAQANDEADYAPAPVPPLPERECLPGLAAFPTWSTNAAATVARLARAGWNIVAVPLDHDPGVRSILPFLVNVVVERG